MNRNLREWLEDSRTDSRTKEATDRMSPEEREDAFHQKLIFGAADPGGKLGPGSSRMNIYTVGLAAGALVQFLQEESYEDQSLVIGHDIHHQNDTFAREVGKVLQAHGIRVYLFKIPIPMPLSAYSVRDLKVSVGIMITVSHNPKEHNGFRVYNNKGIQTDASWADGILEKMNQLSLGDAKKSQEKDPSLVPGRTIESYFAKHLRGQLRNDTNKDFSTTHTPLDGVGNLFVRYVLEKEGLKKIQVTKAQEEPDSDFTTIGYPNPENFAAFDCAIQQTDREGNSFILATDPDSDRVNLTIKHDEKWTHSDGNQIGAPLMDYILRESDRQNRLPERPTVVRSIITGDLDFEVAKELGLERFNTLTGFKNICAPAAGREENGDYTFVSGYGGNMGYTYGNGVFGKDVATISMILCEMAAYYDDQGRDLYDQSLGLYARYKPHRELLYSIIYEGQEGLETMGRIIDRLRKDSLTQINQEEVGEVIDYLRSQKGKTDLAPQSPVQYILKSHRKIFLRPSGTEPKLGIYIYLVDNDLDVTDKHLGAIQEDLAGLFKEIEEAQ